MAALMLAVLVSVGGLGACSGDAGSPSAGSAAGVVTGVSPSDAVTLLAEPDGTVIDVRTPSRFACELTRHQTHVSSIRIGDTETAGCPPDADATDWYSQIAMVERTPVIP